MDAVVLDAAGRPVTGLTRDDFSVSEEGRPREIVSFEAVDLGSEAAPPPSAEAAVVATNAPVRRGGRGFALLLDDLRISRPESEAVRQAAAAFVEKAARDGDEVTIGTTSGRAWWSARLPEGGDDLLAVLRRIDGSYVDPALSQHLTEYEAFWIDTREQGTPVPAKVSALNEPASIKQRVVKRWVSLQRCGQLDRDSTLNCVAR